MMLPRHILETLILMEAYNLDEQDMGGNRMDDRRLKQSTYMAASAVGENRTGGRQVETSHKGK